MVEKRQFYKNNHLLGKFILLYITKFFFYGYLFLAGSIIIGVLFLYLFTNTSGLIKYLQLLWAIPFFYCFIRLINIISTTRYKWRIFRIAHYRLRTRGYSENYFKYEIFEPCTRIIVKNILYEYNLKHEYKLLKEKYLNVNQRIEDEKARILAHVMRKNENNQLQEVAYDKNL